MEEEISLREIIETLLKWKGLIAGITVITLVISGVVSFFVLAPTYEARATLLINQVSEMDVSDVIFVGLGDSFEQVKTSEMDVFDPVQAALQSLSAVFGKIKGGCPEVRGI